MKCKKVNDLLLTDYVDGELTEALQQEVRAHLAACQKCRVFAEEVGRVTTKPLTGIPTLTPPQEVWIRIKSALEEKPEPRFVMPQFNPLEIVRRLIAMPRPVFAAATAIALALTLLIVQQRTSSNREVAIAYLAEQSRFFIVGTPAASADEPFELGTGIEQFLL